MDAHFQPPLRASFAGSSSTAYLLLFLSVDLFRNIRIASLAKLEESVFLVAAVYICRIIEKAPGLPISSCTVHRLLLHTRRRRKGKSRRRRRSISRNQKVHMGKAKQCRFWMKRRLNKQLLLANQMRLPSQRKAPCPRALRLAAAVGGCTSASEVNR